MEVMLDTTNVIGDDPHFTISASHPDYGIQFSYFGNSVTMLPSYSSPNSTVQW